jgi:SRSO17 transposase
MTQNEIIKALLSLGFNSGWVVDDSGIVLWENDVKQPTESELQKALNTK